jgi:hypothetical protein
MNREKEGMQESNSGNLGSSLAEGRMGVAHACL